MGIPEIIAGEIAEEKVAHSWLAPYLRLKGEEYERAESALLKWVDRVAEKMWPEVELAGRLVREAAGLYLEREAMRSWMERNPVRGRWIPVAESAMEAVELGAGEVMYVTREEKRAAIAMLELMGEGMLHPREEEILAKEDEEEDW